MSGQPLYEGRNFTSWNIAKVSEVLCEEWKHLGPVLQKDVDIYGKKEIQISFRGEVSVALEVGKQRFPDKDSVQMYFRLSLSPVPYDLKTHVLNTLDMALFVGLFPQFSGKHFFTIAKTEPWQGSLFSDAAQMMALLINEMRNFESCFHLLLDDEYSVDDIRLDSASLSLSHHLNQVKAYRLAEIYDHPEKLDEAVLAIKRFAVIDEPTQRRLEQLRAAKSAGGMDWLYTHDLLERLGN